MLKYISLALTIPFLITHVSAGRTPHGAASASAEEQRNGAAHYVGTLELTPLLPEGGWFRETYRSPTTVIPSAHRYAGAERSAGTSIYFMLEGRQFGAFHHQKFDEIFSWHKGDVMHVHTLDQYGVHTVTKIGDPDIHEGAVLKHTVPYAENLWIATELETPDVADAFSLVTTDTAPGFDFADVQFVGHNPDFPDLLPASAMASQFPHHASLIYRLSAGATEHLYKVFKPADWEAFQKHPTFDTTLSKGRQWENLQREMFSGGPVVVALLDPSNNIPAMTWETSRRPDGDACMGFHWDKIPYSMVHAHFELPAVIPS